MNTNVKNNENINNEVSTILSFDEGFYTIEDVMKITKWSKGRTQEVFNLKEFPSCDFGKAKIVSIRAFYDFFDKKQNRNDYKSLRTN